MKFLQISLLSVLVLPLLFCSGNNNVPQQNPRGNIQQNAEDEKKVTVDRDYEDRKESDKDRDSVLKRSGERFSDSPKCKDEDRKHECRKICKEIYKRNDREDCEKLSIAQIERLEELHEFFEDSPDEEELEEVVFEDFDVYLNVSIEPLDDLVGDYRTTKVKDFLIWLITNPDFAAVLEKEDGDHEILTTLFKKLDTSFAEATIHTVFLKTLDGGDNLIEFLLENADEDVMDWFLAYINETNEDCAGDDSDDTDDEVNCFEVYCQIGVELNPSDRDEWLDFDSFAEYIEEGIIEDGVNADDEDADSYTWGGTEIKRLKEVDDWVNELCDNNTSPDGADLTD